MARRYLIRNIRVEQNHADHWVQWALASSVERDDLLYGTVPLETHALSHWCWHTCERDTLAAAMAATNYAIEGVTGDWSALVCSKDTYENGFPPESRAKAMKWLKLHARYDDTHPWEALEIISAIMGNHVTRRGADPLRRGEELRIHAAHARPLPAHRPRRDAAGAADLARLSRGTQARLSAARRFTGEPPVSAGRSCRRAWPSRR